MRKLLTPIFLTLLFIQNYAQKSNANIINYFASNNQIIGVPMVDMKNQFRFYPDLSFQEAITGVEVYYFVLNDVYKHHLVQREGGRYWEATLRSFSLGESIQRVEVIVGCSIPQLNSLLVSYGFDHASTKTLNHYLLLRRGDDKGLIKQSTFERLTNALNDKHNAYKANVEALISLLKQSNTLTYILKDQNKSILTKLATAIQTLEVIKTKGTITPKDKANIESAINDVNTDLSATKDSILLNLQSEIQFQNIEITSAFNDYQSVVDKIAPLDLNINNGQFNYDLLKEIAPEPSNKLYAAYVENRLASMLDMKLKENDPTIIQFNYRNDKQSLQYLQADDPQEKLGIFRARLVPFPFYKPPAVVPFEQQDFAWQRGKIVYEIGINFGYAIVKGDHFLPRFFDMNRLGIGIGITADTFSNNPTFLSASLTYDVNTYTSISFGANLVESPGFYMGIGINARAFKDLVKNSGALFKSSD